MDEEHCFGAHEPGESTPVGLDHFARALVSALVRGDSGTQLESRALSVLRASIPAEGHVRSKLNSAWEALQQDAKAVACELRALRAQQSLGQAPATQREWHVFQQYSARLLRTGPVIQAALRGRLAHPVCGLDGSSELGSVIAKDECLEELAAFERERAQTTQAAQGPSQGPSQGSQAHASEGTESADALVAALMAADPSAGGDEARPSERSSGTGPDSLDPEVVLRYFVDAMDENRIPQANTLMAAQGALARLAREMVLRSQCDSLGAEALPEVVRAAALHAERVCAGVRGVIEPGRAGACSFVALSRPARGARALDVGYLGSTEDALGHAVQAQPSALRRTERPDEAGRVAACARVLWSEASVKLQSSPQLAVEEIPQVPLPGALELWQELGRASGLRDQASLQNTINQRLLRSAPLGPAASGAARSWLVFATHVRIYPRDLCAARAAKGDLRAARAASEDGARRGRGSRRSARAAAGARRGAPAR